MAEKSFCFNSINGDRKYKAEDFRDYFASFIGNGVFPNPSTCLQVMGENGDMTVTLKAGKGWVNGAFYVNDADLILPVDVADGVLNRIDRIVLRLDVEGRAINAIVKKGTFASSPVAPALQRDADAYELGIADIYIAAGATQITQANITDLRLDTNLCGIVHGTVEQVDTTTLFNQYLSWYTQTTGQAITGINNIKAQFQNDFNDWFSNIKNILDENTAGNLQNEIDTTNNNLNAHKADNMKQIPHLGTTTNVDDAYSITTAEVINANEKFTIKFNTASMSVPTLSINSGTVCPILKANGNNAKLYASVYTLFWDGSNFILLGEGGEYGTATPEDVLNTKTLGTEQGVQQGLMDLSNLTPDNVKDGVNINGVVGNLEEKLNYLDYLKHVPNTYTPIKYISGEGVYCSGINATNYNKLYLFDNLGNLINTIEPNSTYTIYPLDVTKDKILWTNWGTTITITDKIGNILSNFSVGSFNCYNGCFSKDLTKLYIYQNNYHLYIYDINGNMLKNYQVTNSGTCHAILPYSNQKGIIIYVNGNGVISSFFDEIGNIISFGFNTGSRVLQYLNY